MSAVECRSVGVAFGSAEIVRNVAFTVEPGEWVSIIGPNGAGKTSLLRALAGSVTFTGEIRIDGRDAASLDRRSRSRALAVVAQRPVIPEAVTVLDYVLLGRAPHIATLGVESAVDLAVVADVLEALDLLRFADRVASSLSGGELQRVILARAFAQEAPLLVLDEPTAALDVGRQQEVLDVVDAMRRDRGITVVSAMHDLTLAGQFSDRLLLLSGGEVVAEGHPRDVLTNESIGRHYGASVRIIDDGSGGVIVVPVRKSARADQNRLAEGHAP